MTYTDSLITSMSKTGNINNILMKLLENKNRRHLKIWKEELVLLKDRENNSTISKLKSMRPTPGTWTTPLKMNRIDQMTGLRNSCGNMRRPIMISRTKFNNFRDKLMKFQHSRINVTKLPMEIKQKGTHNIKR
jgi:hypothetical protein